MFFLFCLLFSGISSEMTVFVIDKNTTRRLLTSDVHLFLQSKKVRWFF